jgi:hypothetical protein
MSHISGADVLNIGTVGDWVNATKPWSSTLICPFAFDKQGHHYDSIDTKDYEHSQFAPWGSCYGKLKVRAQLGPCPRGLYKTFGKSFAFRTLSASTITA